MYIELLSKVFSIRGIYIEALSQRLLIVLSQYTRSGNDLSKVLHIPLIDTISSSIRLTDSP